jgi:hypothetical protein
MPRHHPVRRRVEPAARGRCRPRSPGLRPAALTIALTGLLSACGGKAVIDGTAAGEGGAGGHADGPLAVSLTDVTVTIGCKPGYEPPDPVEVSFQATYSNTSAASATATITSATVTPRDPPNTLDWNFDVTPAQVGPIAGGSSQQVDHVKVDGTGSGSGSGAGVPCDFCGAATAPVLEVRYLVDGQYAVTASSNAAVGCLK